MPPPNNPIDQLVSSATNTRKANVQLTGLGPKQITFLNDTVGTPRMRGIYGSSLMESRAAFIKSGCEIVYPFGVVGRDRPGGRDTGYSSTGDTQSEMVDIVVGRLGSDMKGYDETTKERLFVDPDLQRDAARIYISQKSDINENFRLNAPGKAEGRSTVVVKGDGVRIISRETLNLVTGTDPKTSQGGKVRSVPGINLIAGNSDRDLQRFVKGENLVNFLKNLLEKQSRLTGTLMNYINYQLQFNMAVLDHYHISPFFGQETTPDVAVLPSQGMTQLVKMVTNSIGSLATYKMNLKAMSNNYLSPRGTKYINSRNNKTN